MHARVKQVPHAAEPGRYLTHGRRRWHGDCLCPQPLALVADPAEGDLLKGHMLVSHVSDAEEVLPSLARVLRVEVLGLLLHRDLLGLHQVLGHLLLQDCLVQHGPHAAPTGPPLRSGHLQRVDHRQPRLTNRPLASCVQKPRGGCEVLDAGLHPGPLGVGHDDAPLAHRAGGCEEVLQGGAPVFQQAAQPLRQSPGRKVAAQAPGLEQRRGREEGVVPVQEQQGLGGVGVEAAGGRRGDLAAERPGGTRGLPRERP
mmetsp:Transcript_103337/g.301482  ORF Transcript_103337/g.301482 Transcript_103337/m.301482 type:complete len:256 (-) Transcript_103337:45-812(-)